MAGRLYKRLATVQITHPIQEQFFGGTTKLTIKDLRVAFSVEKTLKEEPNKAEVTIYNLAPETRAELQKKPISVRIDAGFDGEVWRLFTGDVRDARSKLDGVDWTTKLLLGDGDRAFTYATVSKSYRGGVITREAVRDSAKALGLTLARPLESIAEIGEQFVNGLTIHGPARSELRRLLRRHNLGWSIQDGQLQILGDTETRADTVRIISADTGMIGVPEFSEPDKKGKPPMLTVKCQLYPQLTPGARIEVRSRSINGIFRMERIKHTGDTGGKPWESEIDAKQL